MSRTIRRKNSRNPYKKGMDGGVFLWYYWVDEWRYHSDNFSPDGSMKRRLKEYTNYIRRNDEREMLIALKKDVECDYYDLEKEYLGHIWNFD